MNALAIANNDVALVAWVSERKIPHCLGFAVYRRDLASGTTLPLPAWVGFKGQSNRRWKPQTTEIWPVQKFHWKDLTARRGGFYQYTIVPMVGKPGGLQAVPTMAWISNPVHLTADRGDVFTFFNRGILSTQALAHAIPAGPGGAPDYKVLKSRIDQPGDPLRKSLAGQLIEGVLTLLDRAATTGGHCYAALYELSDPELVQLLIGSPYAHVILSNTGADDKENQPARQALEESHTDLTSRMLPGQHIGHNKFVVYQDATGTPQAVLAGSTNWTEFGLCAQSNNAIIVENARLAASYRDYWDRLKADTLSAGDNKKLLQARKLRLDNQTPHDFELADHAGSVRVWFSPNTVQKSKTSTSSAPVDLEEVFDLIGRAQQAVLFLAFQPGTPSVIGAVARAQATNPGLFVRGAVTDPNAVNDFDTQLFHLSGTRPDATVVAAAAIIDQFSFWQHELLKGAPSAHAVIHDKIVVTDPFSPDCTVVTGSHNLGYRASYNNDENMLIFRGRRVLAEAYAAHVIDVYDHYRFRYQVQRHGRQAWTGLETNDTWQDKYFARNSPWLRQFAFWQRGMTPVSVPAPAGVPVLRSRALRPPSLGVTAVVPSTPPRRRRRRPRSEKGRRKTSSTRQ